MRKTCIVMGIAALAVVLSTTAFAANRGVQFIEIGELDTGFQPYSFARQFTADGSMVASNYSPFGGCATWTDADGWTDIGITSSTCYISANGATIASRLRDEFDFEFSSVWAGGMDWDVLPGQAGNASCDFFVHGTFNVSGDGGTIGGLTWEGCSFARGFSYTDADGMVVREGLLDDSSRINNLNWDGSTLVGWTRIPWGGWQATKWIDGVAEWIQHPCSDPMQCEDNADFDNFLGEAWWISDDGSVITGSGYNGPPTPNNPFAVPTGWVQYDGGEVIGTDALPGAFFNDQGLAFSSSDDGSIVGGRFGFGPFSSATIWTEATGLINLNQFLINQGLTQPIDGWFMVQVNDISADGTKLLVFAAPPGSFFGSTSVIIDISKVSVCHAPPGNPENARTLMINQDSLADHMAHGDFFGTCEAAGGGFARAANHYDRFGVDPSSMRFQQAVNQYTESHSAMTPVRPSDMLRLIKASTNNELRERVDRSSERVDRDRRSSAR